ncbi:MAG: DUF697 domain-containing protein [Verrucomicrobiae bacterium]|nr:DUF697 domain-containing protein [Verrucomicrobiae bacterium]
MAAATANKTDSFKTETPKACCGERIAKADKIVRKNMYWAMGVGSTPFPLVDVLGIGGFQLKMISELSELYGVKFSEHAARNIVSVLVGSLGAEVLTLGAMASMIKTLPFAGALIGGILCMPAIAGGATYAVGRVFLKHFEAGGTLLDFDTAKMKEFFASQFLVGKKVAAEKPGVAA